MTAALDSFEALLAARYSCRGFRPDPVPRATLERMAAVAQRTASWCNAQPWQLAIASAATTDTLRERLPAFVQAHAPKPDFDWPSAYLGVYQDRRRECGRQLYEAVGIARGDKAAAERQRLENFHFFGAPHVAIVSTDAALGSYGAIDCGAYVGNLMLAARAAGMAAIAQAALAAYPAFWREAFGLGADRRIVCGISFGYEDSEHPANGFRTGRADVQAVCSWH